MKKCTFCGSVNFKLCILLHLCGSFGQAGEEGVIRTRVAFVLRLLLRINIISGAPIFCHAYIMIMLNDHIRLEVLPSSISCGSLGNEAKNPACSLSLVGLKALRSDSVAHQ